MAAEATRGSMLLRFGRLAVHPVVSHVNGFVKRDLGRLVILGILDVAAFDELLSGVRGLGQRGQQFAPGQGQGIVLAEFVDQFVCLVDRLLQFLLDSSNDFVSEVPFEEVLFEEAPFDCPDGLLDDCPAAAPSESAFGSCNAVSAFFSWMLFKLAFRESVALSNVLATRLSCVMVASALQPSVSTVFSRWWPRPRTRR